MLPHLQVYPYQSLEQNQTLWNSTGMSQNNLSVNISMQGLMAIIMNSRVDIDYNSLLIPKELGDKSWPFISFCFCYALLFSVFKTKGISFTKKLEKGYFSFIPKQKFQSFSR